MKSKEYYSIFCPGERSYLVKLNIDCGDIVYFQSGERNSCFIVKKGRTIDGFDGIEDKEKNLLLGLMCCYSGFRFYFSCSHYTYIHYSKEINIKDFNKELKEIEKAPIGYDKVEALAVNYQNIFFPATERELHQYYIDEDSYIPTHSGGFIASKNNKDLINNVRGGYSILGTENLFVNTICAYLNRFVGLFYSGYYQEAGLNLSLITETIILYFKSEHLMDKFFKIESLEKIRNVPYKEAKELMSDKLKLKKKLLDEVDFSWGVRSKIIAHADLLVSEGAGIHWGSADYLCYERIPFINEILIKFINYLKQSKNRKEIEKNISKLPDLVAF
jgi:hypothetical protein